jgi:hypothetical protein
MALACRFCHSDPPFPPFHSYATALSYGSVSAVVCEMERVERMERVIPGYCVQCEDCEKYSMISYALVCHLHGENAEKDPVAHYGNLCRSLKMLDACQFPIHPKAKASGNLG